MVEVLGKALMLFHRSDLGPGLEGQVLGADLGLEGQVLVNITVHLLL